MTGDIRFADDNTQGWVDVRFREMDAKERKVFLLADENTHRYCYSELISRFPILEKATLIIGPEGERNKTLDSCKEIWRQLAEGGADRSSVLVNLGGGVLCDMGGFIASVFKRGIPFYHFPTTLLAQVDAAIGGKTGIDLDGLKNQIGLFARPEAVIIHPAFLKTLDQRQFRSGYAEMFKIALVADAVLLQELLSITKPETEVTSSMVQRAVQLKESVTTADFREQGVRKILNFGHTIGHAIESLMLKTPSPLLHGEAVAAGMITEARISETEGLIDGPFCEEITTYLLSIFGKISIHNNDIVILNDYILHDKKSRAGSVRYSLLKGRGQAAIDRIVAPGRQEEALRYYITL